VKITIKPIEGALDDVPQDHLDKLYVALQTSVKHEGAMSDKDDTEHCCLCVSARLEGASFEHYYNTGIPSNIDEGIAPLSKALQEKNPAKAAVEDGREITLSFAGLNDGFRVVDHYLSLTHPQIAEIIKGNEVVIEVAE